MQPQLWVSPYPHPKSTAQIPLLSRYLTSATIFRGNISSREVSDSGNLYRKSMMTFILFVQAEVCPFVAMLFPICGLLNIIAALACCVARSQYMTSRWRTRNTLWSMCITWNRLSNYWFCSFPWRWIPDNVSVSLVRVPPVGQTQVYRHAILSLQKSTCVFFLLFFISSPLLPLATLQPFRSYSSALLLEYVYITPPPPLSIFKADLV